MAVDSVAVQRGIAASLRRDPDPVLIDVFAETEDDATIMIARMKADVRTAELEGE
jgi:hypothetical protein